MTNLKVQSTVDSVEKPSINDWMNEFNVSSRYQIKQATKHESIAFDMKLFQRNIKKGLILAEE